MPPQFQTFQHTYYRRFLQQQPPLDRFDVVVAMVLSILLCAFISSLGLNSIVRYTLRCSRLAAGDSARLANTGVKKKALKTFSVVKFAEELNLPGLRVECVICLSEFTAGEKIRILPKCNHGFHLRCINKWLNSHSSCPTCRHSLIENGHKIVGHCSLNSGSQLSALVTTVPVVVPSQETVLTIVPLGPEGLVYNY